MNEAPTPLRLARERLGISQGTLSMRSGVSQRTIQSIENRYTRTTRRDVQRKLLRGLGVAWSKRADIFGALAVLILLVGCGMKADATSEERVGTGIKLELMFEHEGCRMYRFYDLGYRYWATCPGDVSWTERCGKHCSRPAGVQTTVTR